MKIMGGTVMLEAEVKAPLSGVTAVETLFVLDVIGPLKSVDVHGYMSARFSEGVFTKCSVITLHAYSTHEASAAVAIAKAASRKRRDKPKPLLGRQEGQPVAGETPYWLYALLILNLIAVCTFCVIWSLK